MPPRPLGEPYNIVPLQIFLLFYTRIPLILSENLRRSCIMSASALSAAGRRQTLLTTRARSTRIPLLAACAPRDPQTSWSSSCPRWTRCSVTFSPRMQVQVLVNFLALSSLSPCSMLSASFTFQVVCVTEKFDMLWNFQLQVYF